MCLSEWVGYVCACGSVWIRFRLAFGLVWVGSAWLRMAWTVCCSPFLPFFAACRGRPLLLLLITGPHCFHLLLLLMLAAVAFIDYSTVQVQAHYRPAVRDVGVADWGGPIQLSC